MKRKGAHQPVSGVDAGIAHFQAGRLQQALTAFLEVTAEDPAFPTACLWAICIAAQLRTVTFRLMDAVHDFLELSPSSPNEVDALRALVAVYEEQGLDDDARAILAHLAAVAPDPSGSEHSAVLDRTGADSDLTAIAEQDLAFWSPERGPRAAPQPRSVTPAVAEPRSRPGETSEQVGAVIAGRYQLEAEIGRGGMGTVYRALDRELGERIALKIFSQALADPSAVERFKQELRLCREITHPNVVRVHDIGTHGGRKFITMELLQGKSLRARMREVDVRSTLGYLVDVCVALEQVHAAGIVHRDIKPTNVFVTTADVVKLMDFGLAKKVSQVDGLTASGFMAGTPGYMAPEQAMGFGAATQAADLYAIGVILYEALTGRRPFVSKNPVGVVQAQLTETPTPPSQLHPLPHPSLEPLILRLLDRAPELRPGCSEVRSVLLRVLGRRR